MQLQGRNLSFGMEGEDVALLHSELHQLGYEISAGEIEGKIFDDATADADKDLQNKHDRRPPPDFDEAELRALVDKETARLINAEVDAASFTVEGKVTSRSRAGVDGLKVHIVDKNCGEDVVLKHEPTKTDENGAYRVAFAMADLRRGRGKERPDLQARVSRDDKFLGASEVRYNASEHETLNVLLTDEAASALPSEHESLVDVLAANCQHSLRDLQETDDRQDITYLANKTGWDARAVALAALGDQFSARARDAEGNASIEPALFYALFRAGLPANEAALYQTDPKSAEAIWKQAIEQGVIPAGLEDGLPAAVERFQELAAQHVLDAPALVGVSSLKEILSVSLGEDPDPQRQKEKEEQFAGLYTRHRGDLPTFWQAVRDAFGEPAEKRLKLDGQLAYLTLNNAPLIRKLHRKLHEAGGQDGLTDALHLVEEGYHRAEKWQEVIGNDPIPPEIFVEDDPDTRSRYAELLAAQVRLSFPTAVVAHMVKSGDTPLADGLADPVHGFLTEQLGKFEIGMQPVEQYVVRNNLDVAPEVTKEVTRIQRVYQITPSGDAMNVLMNKGLDSAYHVVRYSQDEFVRAFKDDLGGEENARLTYAKAQQVHNAVLNIASSYLIASTAPAIGVHSPAHNVDPKPQGPAPDANAGDVIAYPTLEKLFGEMDYCGCEHCRSWLSPAAYLVDLLQFIDRPVNPPGSVNPQDVFFVRRPDIQHLPLTC